MYERMNAYFVTKDTVFNRVGERIFSSEVSSAVVKIFGEDPSSVGLFLVSIPRSMIEFTQIQISRRGRRAQQHRQLIYLTINYRRSTIIRRGGSARYLFLT